jgi:hypothetical protein
MNINNGHLFEDGPEDINNYPRAARISAQRAIAKAELEAKNTLRSFKSKFIFVCRLPSHAAPSNYRTEDLRSGSKK